MHERSGLQSHQVELDIKLHFTGVSRVKLLRAYVSIYLRWHNFALLCGAQVLISLFFRIWGLIFMLISMDGFYVDCPRLFSIYTL
jgi:hypothetical protein